MSTIAAALAAGWTLTDDHGAELPPAPCAGSGQIVMHPMRRERCPECSRIVETVPAGMVSALRTHYPERVAPPEAGPNAAPTISLDL